MNGKSLKKEFGDYQTPLEFAYDVCSYLNKYLKIVPNIIIEPTCGLGNFIKASIDTFENLKKVYGIEINEDYCAKCEDKFNDNNVDIICDNFFSFKAKKLVNDEEDELLVIGNPPWATNSELSFNVPKKMNFKKLSGTDAMTGASNFDICEYMILKIIEEFKNTNTTIAMLCKTSVARNVFAEMTKNKYSSEYIKMLNFNANKVFGIGASACLLVIKLSNSKVVCNSCEVMDFEFPKIVNNIITYNKGLLSNFNDDIYDLSGCCQFEWRQGVKHDCSSIMELKKDSDNLYINKRKDTVELENDLVFPLMKSSSFKKAIINDNFNKYVIVTQKKVRDDTSSISYLAPLTWKYLLENKELFDNRRSSIYNGAPPFSMFGVGDYSYAKYKVGISGFYKKPLFSLLYNKEDPQKPIMLDDTSYFISFDDYDLAYVCMLLLNCNKVQKFLYSISFKDAKRPYTKKVLQRIDFKKCMDNVTIEELIQTENLLGIDNYVTDILYNKAKLQIMRNERVQMSLI